MKNIWLNLCNNRYLNRSKFIIQNNISAVVTFDISLTCPSYVGFSSAVTEVRFKCFTMIFVRPELGHKSSDVRRQKV